MAMLFAVAGFAFLFVAIPAVRRHAQRDDLSAHTFQVKITNKRQDTYIWINNEASASVWIPGADAGDNPIAWARAHLELPKNRLGSGFQVQPQETANGQITLPTDFELQRYIRKGYELRLAVRVVPRGYYSREFPYKDDPQIEFGNAHGRASLSRKFPHSVVRLSYGP